MVILILEALEMIVVTLTDGGTARQSRELPDGNYAVGRSRENQVIVMDPSVSGRHCELLVFGHEVIVRESGSRNGTFVDGVRVEGQRAVANGQCLQIGQVRFEVSWDVSPPTEDSQITAYHDHCRRLRKAEGDPSLEPVFPIVFETRSHPPHDSERDPAGRLEPENEAPRERSVSRQG